jgi:hypothetical protein
MDFSEIQAIGLPVLALLMVAAAILHAWFAAMKLAPDRRFFRPRVIVVSVLHLLFAGIICRFLNSGGWLTASYRWNDPDNYHLVIALFEALSTLAVIAAVAARKTFFYKLLVDFLVIQLIIAASLLALFLVFVLTYQPRMF